MTEQEILIGWPEGKPHSESGEDISEIARKLSFGAGPQTWTKSLGGKTETFHVDHVPARPILDDAIGSSEGKEEIGGRVGKYYEKVTNGEESKSLLHAIGATAVGVVQKFARMGSYKSSVPNSQAWADFKQGSPPWIDTGEVINSLTYVVEDKTFTGKEDSGKKEWTVN